MKKNKILVISQNIHNRDILFNEESKDCIKSNYRTKTIETHKAVKYFLTANEFSERHFLTIDKIGINKIEGLLYISAKLREKVLHTFNYLTLED